MWPASGLTNLSSEALLSMVTPGARVRGVTLNAMASLGMVTPGAEFRGVTLHRLYFKECIVGNVY